MSVYLVLIQSQLTSLTWVISMSLIIGWSALSTLRSHAFIQNKSTHTLCVTGFILPYALGKLFDSSESYLTHAFSKKTCSHNFSPSCMYSCNSLMFYMYKFILFSFKWKIKNLGFRRKAFQNKRENPIISDALNPCHQHI